MLNRNRLCLRRTGARDAVDLVRTPGAILTKGETLTKRSEVTAELGLGDIGLAEAMHEHAREARVEEARQVKKLREHYRISAPRDFGLGVRY